MVIEAYMGSKHSSEGLFYTNLDIMALTEIPDCQDDQGRALIVACEEDGAGRVYAFYPPEGTEIGQPERYDVNMTLIGSVGSTDSKKPLKQPVFRHGWEPALLVVRKVIGSCAEDAADWYNAWVIGQDAQKPTNTLFSQN